MKTINKYKEPDLNFISPKIESKVTEKALHKKSTGDIRLLAQKQTSKNNPKKELEFNNSLGANQTKPKNKYNKWVFKLFIFVSKKDTLFLPSNY